MSVLLLIRIWSPYTKTTKRFLFLLVLFVWCVHVGKGRGSNKWSNVSNWMLIYIDIYVSYLINYGNGGCHDRIWTVAPLYIHIWYQTCSFLIYLASLSFIYHSQRDRYLKACIKYNAFCKGDLWWERTKLWYIF